MLHQLKKYFICVCITLLTSFSVYAQDFPIITSYMPTKILCYDQDNNFYIAIRTYFYNGETYYLVVNPTTFETHAAPAANFTSRMVIADKPGYLNIASFTGSRYGNVILHNFPSPSKVKDYGIIHATHPVDGYFLTIDMCPSTKPFEQEFFDMLVKKSEDEHQPIPIAISITGLWIIKHPDEFNWLIQQEKANKLQITWINHTYDHAYYADMPFENNFLLTKLEIGNENDSAPSSLKLSNFKFEVLYTEQLLLQRGEVPSVFFRFPGLASNEKLIHQLQKFGLIPIGTDSWLNKIGKNDNSDMGEVLESQNTTPGSIVLVHGNSNEHAGIELAMPLVQPATFHLLPLSQAFGV